jgi:hypothetical protein
LPPLHSHVPTHEPTPGLQDMPGVPPLTAPHPPQALQLGLHQSSFWSAAHSHEPQQPPFGAGGVQPLCKVNFSPPQPPHTLRDEAPLHWVAFCPLQPHFPSPHVPHEPPGGLVSVEHPPHALAGDAPWQLVASAPLHLYVPPQPHDWP